MEGDLKTHLYHIQENEQMIAPPPEFVVVTSNRTREEQAYILNDVNQTLREAYSTLVNSKAGYNGNVKISPMYTQIPSRHASLGGGNVLENHKKDVEKDDDPDFYGTDGAVVEDADGDTSHEEMGSMTASNSHKHITLQTR